MQTILRILLSAVAVFVTAYILPGVKIANFLTAIVAAIFFAVVNAFIKPVLVILTLPINILTLGFFTLVINALLVMLVAAIVPGFEIRSFWWAMLYSVILSIVSYVLNTAFK